MSWPCSGVSPALCATWSAAACTAVVACAAMAAPPSEARLMPARISTPDAAVTLCSLSALALASVAAVAAAELPSAGAPELGSSTEVTPNKIKGVSGGGGGGGRGGGGSGGEGLGRLCRTIGGCGAGGGGSGSGGGKGGCRFRGPQSVQSVPYAHDAPLDVCPPSWQMPFLTKGHSSRQTVGGGDGKGGSGGKGSGKGRGKGGSPPVRASVETSVTDAIFAAYRVAHT